MPTIKHYTVSDLEGNRHDGIFPTYDAAKQFAEKTYPTTSYQIDAWKLAEKKWHHQNTTALLRATESTIAIDDRCIGTLGERNG
jgi:hypothetical protein